MKDEQHGTGWNTQSRYRKAMKQAYKRSRRRLEKRLMEDAPKRSSYRGYS